MRIGSINLNFPGIPKDPLTRKGLSATAGNLKDSPLNRLRGAFKDNSYRQSIIVSRGGLVYKDFGAQKIAFFAPCKCI